jgi:hypothetical protein
MGLASSILSPLLKPAKKVASKIMTNGVKVSAPLAQHRFRLCKSCPHLLKTTGNCKKCGCFADVKTKYADQRCPVGKW